VLTAGAQFNVSLKLVGDDDVVVAYDDDSNQIMKCFVALAVDDAALSFTHLLQQ